jgi:hypothetical protein
MKKIAHFLAVSLVAAILLVTAIGGILHYQEGNSGGAIVAVLAMLAFYLTLIHAEE